MGSTKRKLTGALLPAANRVPRLLSQLLFVLPLSCPRALYRPKQALDATHRHYYSYMCCLFWQHIKASMLLCYLGGTLPAVRICKSVKYGSLQPRICTPRLLHSSSISPAPTKTKDKTVALQLISLASSRNPCVSTGTIMCKYGGANGIWA